MIGLCCCSSQDTYHYNRIDGISDGCPVPEDSPTPYQATELSDQQFADLTGIDLNACLPRPRTGFTSTYQYGYFSETNPTQPSSIRSVHINGSETQIDIEVIWDDLAPNSVLQLFQTEGRIISTIDRHAVIFYHEPANGPVNYDGFHIYAAVFSINNTKYFVRVQNNASKHMLERICSSIISNLSNQ